MITDELLQKSAERMHWKDAPNFRLRRRLELLEDATGQDTREMLARYGEKDYENALEGAQEASVLHLCGHVEYILESAAAHLRGAAVADGLDKEIVKALEEASAGIESGERSLGALIAHYGFGPEEPQSLNDISSETRSLLGAQNTVTRERVRQIEGRLMGSLSEGDYKARLSRLQELYMEHVFSAEPKWSPEWNGFRHLVEKKGLPYSEAKRVERIIFSLAGEVFDFASMGPKEARRYMEARSEDFRILSDNSLSGNQMAEKLGMERSYINLYRRYLISTGLVDKKTGRGSRPRSVGYR